MKQEEQGLINYYTKSTTKQMANEKLVEIRMLNSKIYDMATKGPSLELDKLISKEKRLTREYLDFTRKYWAALRTT